MKLITIKQLLFCSILLPVLSFASDKTTLIVSYGDYNAAPYAMETGEQLSSGIIKDIATELGDELGITVSFLRTPRKRIERYLSNNTSHVHLISNPAWLNNSDKFQWSDALFTQQERMVINADNTNKYEKLSDFKGMIIGTIRGYKYPTLQVFFDKGDLIPYGVSNLAVNLIRLDLKRVDVVIDSNILINYQLKQLKKKTNESPFRVLPIIVSQVDIKAIISPSAPVTLEQFNQALRKLKDQGVIDAIMKKYNVT